VSTAETVSHRHEESFPVSPETLFQALVTPSAVRRWWSAARVIVVPEPGGVWAAAWGEDEDVPDYVSTSTMTVFDPPRRLVFDEYRYFAREGPLPFEADFVTEFEVEARPEGASLRVTQSGFPRTPEGEAFLSACEKGWRDTFRGLREFLS
jgi:uncharacterized protein YndB with AHSA1/START domain